MKRKRKEKAIKAAGCPVGREHDANHPTCRSCPIDCSKAGRRGAAEIVTTTFKGKQLCTTAYLYSPNSWHGRPLHVYLAQKRKWRLVFEGTWALWGRQTIMRRRITVVRQVTSEDSFISDDDNLRFCLKPLLDNLKAQGVIVDDARQYIDEPIISQVLGGRQMVTVEVTDTDSPIEVQHGSR